MGSVAIDVLGLINDALDGLFRYDQLDLII